jgi:hypothetical protein
MQDEVAGDWSHAWREASGGSCATLVFIRECVCHWGCTRRDQGAENGQAVSSQMGIRNFANQFPYFSIPILTTQFLLRPSPSPPSLAFQRTLSVRPPPPATCTLPPPSCTSQHDPHRQTCNARQRCIPTRPTTHPTTPAHPPWPACHRNPTPSPAPTRTPPSPRSRTSPTTHSKRHHLRRQQQQQHSRSTNSPRTRRCPCSNRTRSRTRRSTHQRCCRPSPRRFPCQPPCLDAERLPSPRHRPSPRPSHPHRPRCQGQEVEEDSSRPTTPSILLDPRHPRRQCSSAPNVIRCTRGSTRGVSGGGICRTSMASHSLVSRGVHAGTMVRRRDASFLAPRLDADRHHVQTRTVPRARRSDVHVRSTRSDAGRASTVLSALAVLVLPAEREISLLTARATRTMAALTSEISKDGRRRMRMARREIGRRTRPREEREGGRLSLRLRVASSTPSSTPRRVGGRRHRESEKGPLQSPNRPSTSDGLSTIATPTRTTPPTPSPRTPPSTVPSFPSSPAQHPPPSPTSQVTPFTRIRWLPPRRQTTTRRTRPCRLHHLARHSRACRRGNSLTTGTVTGTATTTVCS